MRTLSQVDSDEAAERGSVAAVGGRAVLGTRSDPAVDNARPKSSIGPDMMPSASTAAPGSRPCRHHENSEQFVVVMSSMKNWAIDSAPTSARLAPLADDRPRAVYSS